MVHVLIFEVIILHGLFEQVDGFIEGGFRDTEVGVYALEAAVIPACIEVGATLVAYSPLGRGMLSGRFKDESVGEGDFRSFTPRFQGDAFAANEAQVDEIEAVASAKSCTPSQVALAWVLGRGEHVMTIPGTTKLANLKDNLGAYDIRLSDDEQATLDQLADRVMGDRYDEQGMAIIDA